MPIPAMRLKVVWRKGAIMIDQAAIYFDRVPIFALYA